MSYLKDYTLEKTRRVDTLTIGKKFVKVRTGLPSTLQYRFDGVLGGMIKATKLKDNSPVLFPNYVLVYPLN